MLLRKTASSIVSGRHRWEQSSGDVINTCFTCILTTLETIVAQKSTLSKTSINGKATTGSAASILFTNEANVSDRSSTSISSKRIGHNLLQTLSKFSSTQFREKPCRSPTETILLDIPRPVAVLFSNETSIKGATVHCILFSPFRLYFFFCSLRQGLAIHLFTMIFSSLIAIDRNQLHRLH